MSQVRTIDPREMTAEQWTAAVTLDLEQFGSMPQLLDSNRWQDWAATVVGTSAISGVVLPDPYSFPTWSDWAMRFNEIMDSWNG